jgi:transcriptional regulator with XRE-family HTH domain
MGPKASDVQKAGKKVEDAVLAMGPLKTKEPLQHLADVRKAQGMSRSKVAGLLGISTEEVRRQELPSADLFLSQLYAWQRVLNVPAHELLRPPDHGLDPDIAKKAKLVRLMKTALSIAQAAQTPDERRMTAMFIDQLDDISIGLSNAVNPWPSVGKKRTFDDMGVAYDRRINGETMGEE